MKQNEELGFASSMGPQLRAEVERQLLDDLAHYGITDDQLFFDWSDTVPEGHVTRYLDGRLENWSGIAVTDKHGRCLAAGWLEFIHGGGDNPLFVFWQHLTTCRDGRREEAKRAPGIPLHVWQRLPEHSRALCTMAEDYDARWSNDPLVKQWKRNA